MGFFDTAMNQADFGRVSYIGMQNRRSRVSIHPGAHGNLFSGIRRVFRKGHPVPHRLSTVTDSRCRCGQTGMMVHRWITVLILYLQFIMKEYCIFPKSRFPRLIDICKQPAFYFFSVLRVIPFCPWGFHDNRTEQPVYVGAFLTASAVRHILKQIYSLFFGIPCIGNRIFCGAVLVKSHLCPI